VLHHKNALDSLFTMLLKKRIDIFPENQYVAANKAQQLGKLQSIDIVPSGASDDVHFGFRDNPTGRELAVQFDEGVRELKSTGKFDQILNTYGLR
jgi:ABC-type amino acid transport substrate-binding protein